MPKRKRYPRTVEQALYDKAKNRCSICARAIEFRDGTIDHIIPLNKDGPEHPTNLQWACWSCNIIKNDRYTDEEVRELLGLPVEYGEALKLRIKEKKQPQIERTILKYPSLKTEGLDVSEIKKNIDLIHKTYQSETIIPELFKTSIFDDSIEDSINIGMYHRYPIEWVLPNANSNVFNDPIFEGIGRSIAFGERRYLENRLMKSITVEQAKLVDSSETFLNVFKQIQETGFSPDIIWPTIPLWQQLHHWDQVNIEYPTKYYNKKIKSHLKVDGNKLKVIPPLGETPNVTYLMNSDKITWRVKRFETHGALFIEMGRDRLYPDTFFETIAFTTTKLELKDDAVKSLTYS